jgi:hypothetical protein
MGVEQDPREASQVRILVARGDDNKEVNIRRERMNGK